jgi:hypothetical protein
MYAIRGEVYGAYTVNLMRSRMGLRERNEHDQAWGLSFGNPNSVRVVPTPKKLEGLFKSWIGKPATEMREHPMSEAMAPKLLASLAKDPSLAQQKDERGWTLLHKQSLAGSAATVKVLLDAGADPSARTNDGMTPLQLAKTLRWENVAALLLERGAT